MADWSAAVPLRVTRYLREAQTWLLNLGTRMMRSTGVMAMTTTATDCEWSFLAAAGAPEVALVGSVVRLEADMDLHPGAQSTGSLCQVNITLAKIHFAGLI